jgi:hypothetical protein
MPQTSRCTPASVRREEVKDQDTEVPFRQAERRIVLFCIFDAKPDRTPVGGTQNAAPVWQACVIMVPAAEAAGTELQSN